MDNTLITNTCTTTAKTLNAKDIDNLVSKLNALGNMGYMMSPSDINWCSWNAWTINMNKDLITNIKMIVPNKVMEVTIDGNVNMRQPLMPVKSGTYKMVLREPDQFDMKYGCALAIAKAIYSKYYTHEYLESMVPEILGIKYFVKEIDKAIKKYNNKLKEEEKLQKQEEERKAIVARRKEKNRKRKQKRLEKQRQEQIDIIAKAIEKTKE